MLYSILVILNQYRPNMQELIMKLNNYKMRTSCSWAEIARQLGVNYSWLMKIVAGDETPGVLVRQKLAAFLDDNISESE